jgi:CRP/FNR family transcriptional regulator, cyclic AMP receptor protein
MVRREAGARGRPSKIGAPRKGLGSSEKAAGQQTSTGDSGHGLLAALPEHLFTGLFRRATTVRLKPDEILFLIGDAGDGCYRVEDGLLKVTMVSRTGTERILAILGPGAIVGEMSIIDGLPRSASVVAVRAAVLRFLRRSDFADFAKKHPEVYQSLVTLLAARLRETDTTVAAGSFLPLRGRIARTLLDLAQDFGKDVGAGRIVIHQRIGQSDLAAMAGIARESLSRILTDWQRRKLISRLSGYYCIEDKAQLQREQRFSGPPGFLLNDRSRPEPVRITQARFHALESF